MIYKIYYIEESALFKEEMKRMRREEILSEVGMFFCIQ